MHALKNPRISQITFHTFCHWKATAEYAKTKDILYVNQLLGHKRIEATLIYTQLVNFESDDYHVKVSSTSDEACELIEAGFECVTDLEGKKIFRKRKEPKTSKKIWHNTEKLYHKFYILYNMYIAC